MVKTRDALTKSKKLEIELNNKVEKFYNIVLGLCRFDTFCGTRTESKNFTLINIGSCTDVGLRGSCAFPSLKTQTWTFVHFIHSKKKRMSFGNYYYLNVCFKNYFTN